MTSRLGSPRNLTTEDKDAYLQAIMDFENGSKFLVPAAWGPLVGKARDVARWVVMTRVVPPGKEAELAAISRSLEARSTTSVSSWWARNKKGIYLLLDALEWPGKEDEGVESPFQEIVHTPQFKIHNTVHLEGERLNQLIEFVGSGAKVLLSNLKSKETAYGDVYIVNKLLKNNWNAWYNIGDDDIFIRSETKRGPAEIRTLVHEFGHRWWHKFASMSVKAKVGEMYFSLKHQVSSIAPIEPGKPIPIDVPGYSSPPIVSYVVNGKVVLKDGKGLPLKAVNDIYGFHQKAKKFPTVYSATNESEYWAECFAHYLLNQLDDPHFTMMQEILG